MTEGERNKDGRKAGSVKGQGSRVQKGPLGEATKAPPHRLWGIRGPCVGSPPQEF